MQTSRSVALVAAAAALVSAGAVALVVEHRAPTALPPLATTASTATPAPAGTLPFHLTSPASCPAYALDSPVATTGGHADRIPLVGAPQTAEVSVVCIPAAPVGGLDGLIDHLRRHPQDSFLVSEPVVERDALGDAVRTEEHLSDTMLTEWRVERGGQIVTVGYLRRAGDETETAEVESMLASWTWG